MLSTTSSSSASNLSEPPSQWWDDDKPGPWACRKSPWGRSRSARTASIAVRCTIFVAIGVSLGLLIVATVVPLLYMRFVLQIKDRTG
ncbi:hypothetical protein K438DRAFT_1972943 [Mycena galopus ATCC 62051]|nr:hypothetical protein K438DRAFT_1972943 [Mycena galopus ATCC 62051]